MSKFEQWMEDNGFVDFAGYMKAKNKKMFISYMLEYLLENNILFDINSAQFSNVEQIADYLIDVIETGR